MKCTHLQEGFSKDFWKIHLQENINLLFLSFFQGFFSAAFFAAGLRQCWQWRKTSSRSKKMKHAGSWKSRWPVTLVAWMPFPPFLLVGTWGNSSCWSWVSRGDAQSSRCSACFFSLQSFLHLHCCSLLVWNQIESGECSTNGLMSFMSVATLRIPLHQRSRLSHPAWFYGTHVQESAAAETTTTSGRREKGAWNGRKDLSTGERW